MPPLISHKTISLPPPSDTDRRAFDQRLRDALGVAPLNIPLPLLRSLRSLDGMYQEIPCTLGRVEHGYRLISVESVRSYSIALDLGSTNLVALLYDNVARKEILSRTFENPQVEFGSDILTRMHHAMSGNSEEVYRVLTNGINGLVAALCREAEVNTRDIHALVAAGNTAMTHFFLGLDVSTIPVAPWTPVVRTPGFLAAAELELDLNPDAVVYAFPNAGSYVGGDITAGIIAAGMHRSADLQLLVDVGTNAEVVIGNRDWMIVGAGAAGPALEEGVSRIGKRATSGIVYDVTIENGAVSCRTFDDAVPAGICGSGMVSLLYEMHRSGMIDQTGVLTDNEHVTVVDGERTFAVSCDGRSGLRIAESEIRNFLRSKAAMFTLLLTLTRSVGVSFRDIRRVFVSGALGSGIDARKAAGIGMMPAWPPGTVQAAGNTSLDGCRKLLADADVAKTANELVGRITYKHMHDDPEFMKEYLGAVFIPHTDPELLNI